MIVTIRNTAGQAMTEKSLFPKSVHPSDCHSNKVYQAVIPYKQHGTSIYII